MYLLDTNIISYGMRGDLQLIRKIKSRSAAELSLSTITLAEIYYGIEKSSVKRKSVESKLGKLNPSFKFFLLMTLRRLKTGLGVSPWREI